MVIPTLIDLKSVELKCYLFILSLDKYNGSCNVLSWKIRVPKIAKGIYIQVINVITNKSEARMKTKNISCNCKCKFNSTLSNSNQKWNNKTCQDECNNYHKGKKVYSWNPTTCMCDNSNYLKSIADSSVIACDEIISVMNTVSTKRKKTIATMYQ